MIAWNTFYMPMRFSYGLKTFKIKIRLKIRDFSSKNRKNLFLTQRNRFFMFLVLPQLFAHRDGFFTQP